jgi:hypothetical protein
MKKKTLESRALDDKSTLMLDSGWMSALPSPISAISSYVSWAISRNADKINISIDKDKTTRKYSTSVFHNGDSLFLPEEEETFLDLSLSEYHLQDIGNESILKLPQSLSKFGQLLNDQRYLDKEDLIPTHLCWLSLCDTVLYTFPESSVSVGWRCSVDRTKENIVLKNEVLFPEDLECLVDKCLSRITLFGLSRSDIRALNPEQMAQYFGSYFRDPIIAGLDLSISKGGCTVDIEPEEYLGKLVVKEEIVTQKGPMYLEIYFSPGKNNMVKLKSRNRTLLRNIASAEGIDEHLWNSGLFKGHVRADWTESSVPGRINDRVIKFLAQEVSEYDLLLERYIRGETKPTEFIPRDATPIVLDDKKALKVLGDAFDILIHENAKYRYLITQNLEVFYKRGGMPTGPYRLTIKEGHDFQHRDATSRFDRQNLIITLNAGSPSYQRAAHDQEALKFYRISAVSRELLRKCKSAAGSHSNLDEMVRIQTHLVHYYNKLLNH